MAWAREKFSRPFAPRAQETQRLTTTFGRPAAIRLKFTRETPATTASKPPKIKKSVDTFQRIPLKGRSTPGPLTKIRTKKNKVETRRAFQQKPVLSPSSTS